MTDNEELQRDELEVLSSVYENQWKCENLSHRNFSIEILEGGCQATLYITLPPAYPSEAPPIFQISAPSLTRCEKQEMSNRLEAVYLENIGESVLYQWIESIRSFLQEKSDEKSQTLISQLDDHLSDENVPINVQNVTSCKVPPITHGEIIVDRKSIFQGHVATVTSTQEVESVLSKLKENKKIANATHNIYAYRIRKEDKKYCLLQDCDDDGENQAGGRLLHLLQIMDVYNVLVVVTRWYGGVHIGPDRFRHINNAAREALIKAGFTSKKK